MSIFNEYICVCVCAYALSEIKHECNLKLLFLCALYSQFGATKASWTMPAVTELSTGDTLFKANIQQEGSGFSVPTVRVFCR